MLGERWSGTQETPIEVLKRYKDEMPYPENSKTWKRRQWTGFVRTGPRSTVLDVDQPLTREHDHYPICSKFLIDMTIDIHDRILSLTKRIDQESIYKAAFLEAGGDQKLIDALFAELRIKKPDLKRVKTALRRVQRSHQAEEQLLYKNGLRMVVRELLRMKE